MLTYTITVAILAQGTSLAVAAKQAFLPEDTVDQFQSICTKLLLPNQRLTLNLQTFQKSQT